MLGEKKNVRVVSRNNPADGRRVRNPTATKLSKVELTV